MKNKLPRHASTGVNHFVIALIDNLQEHLERPVRGSGYVHRIRVDIKRLRAWIRLIRDNEDAIGLRDMDHKLRDIMKQLGNRRDQQALVESLKWLEKRADKYAGLPSMSILRSHIEQGHKRAPVDWSNIKSALLQVLGSLKQHTQKIDSIHMVRDGLQRTFKRAAKSGDKAFSGKMNPACMHEFRKWIKYLFYQLEFIQAAHPELSGMLLDDLEDLGNRLGRFNDLVPVKKRLQQMPEKKKYVDAVKRMEVIIDNSKHKLLRRANRHYRKIFSSSSSRIIKNLT